MPKRKYIDWDSVEPLYRAGTMSLNDICRQYEADHINSQVWKSTVTHPAILKKVKQKKWGKNLSGRVKERIQEKLVTELVTSGNKSEDEIVESATEEPIRIARGQRARTQALLKIQDELTIELQNSKSTDIMSRVRGFKDIAIAVRSHHADQAEQYKLNEQTSTEKTRIRVSRVSVDE